MENNRNYWLHRISGGNNAWGFAHDLLNKHLLLSIGWSDFSTTTFLKQIENNPSVSTIDNEYKSHKWDLSRNRWNLYRFLMQMKKGDIVVVPTTKHFSIYEVADEDIYCNETLPEEFLEGRIRKGNYIYKAPNEKIDLGFYRKVNLLQKDLERDKFARQALVSRMKIRQTNSLLNENDIIKNIDASINLQKVISLKESIMQDVAPIVLKQIRDISDDHKFEKLVEWYLTSLGAKIVKTPAKNSSTTEDGDADKVAFFEKLNVVVLVQAKKHVDITDQWAIRQIKNYENNNEFDDNVPVLWVVSTCDDFSEQAKKEAGYHNVRLINGFEFARMIIDTGLSNLDQ